MASPLVMYAIPTYGSVPVSWAMAKASLATPLGAATFDYYILGPQSIAEKRNMAVRAAREAGAKYLFFIGDDTIPPAEAFMVLMQKMKFNPDIKIIGGMYFSRSLPPQPMAWKGYMEGSFYDWHVGELFEVDWMGCDCLLLDMSIFDEVQEPWFSQDYVFGPTQAKPIALATEDIYFYEKMKAAGFKIWMDASIQCIHQDRNTGMQYALPADWPQANPAVPIPQPNPDHMVADIGAGWSSPYTSGKLVRFDINPAVNPDVRCDIHSIPMPDQCFDEVWSRHSLEHFSAAEAPVLIQEWSRILKIGGKLQINVPNLEAAIKVVLDPDAHEPASREYAMWQIYGAQTDPYDYHKNGFTKRLLKNLVLYAWGDEPIHGVDASGQIFDGRGCFDPESITIEEQNGGINLQLTAVKIRHPRPAIIGPEGRFSTPVAAEDTHMEAGRSEDRSEDRGNYMAFPERPDRSAQAVGQRGDTHH